MSATDAFTAATATYRAAVRHPHKTGPGFEVLQRQAAYDAAHRGLRNAFRRWAGSRLAGLAAWFVFGGGLGFALTATVELVLRVAS